MSEWDNDIGDAYAEDSEAEQTGGGSLSAPGPAAAFDAHDDSIVATIVRAAQGMRRDPKVMIERAKLIGSLLGKKGFYRFPIGGKPIEGESVHLAQALAQEWGGTIFKTEVLTADPIQGGGQRVHLRSSCADLVTIVLKQGEQVFSTAPPPAKFAKDHEQRERWNAMQMQNACSKCERNVILDALPKWFTGPAFEAAKLAADSDALGYRPAYENGKPVMKDGKPVMVRRTLEQARAASVEALTELGCTKEELERYLEQPYEMWAVPQIAALRELFQDLKRSKFSIEQWRANLADAETPKQQAPTRNSLGLPSTTTNAVDDAALKAATKQNAKAEQQQELPK